MVNVAILGYGVVGSSVYRYLTRDSALLLNQTGQTVKVRKILVRREFPGDPAETLMTRDINEILSDDSINIVVEAMGGLEPAYTYVKRALEKGKSVVTSNKELVAEKGANLLRTARDHHTRFLFEASVGGGVPLIASLTRNLLIDRVTSVAGILNGTTNYILTEMDERGSEYTEALREAQSKGYAESDPSADVEGLDTSRKLAILLSLISGKTVDWKDIPREGVTSLTKSDFIRAGQHGYTIRLLGVGKLDTDGVHAITAPFMIRPGNPLAVAKGVFNSVLFNTEWNGPVMFYGQGAGGSPTTAAVISDIAEAVRHPGNDGPDAGWTEDKALVLPFDASSFDIVNNLRIWRGGE